MLYLKGWWTSLWSISPAPFKIKTTAYYCCYTIGQSPHYKILYEIFKTFWNWYKLPHSEGRGIIRNTLTSLFKMVKPTLPWKKFNKPRSSIGLFIIMLSAITKYFIWHQNYINALFTPLLHKTNTSLCLSFPHGCPDETYAIGRQIYWCTQKGAN